MIGSECRRKNNQFKNILLNAQDRVNCNKIIEIKEDRFRWIEDTPQVDTISYFI